MGMRRLLFGVTPLDPVNIATIAGTFALIAVVASLAPAVRAARHNNVDVIRSA
jgi:ABC-type lipoprotein release transport system permease subunit